MKLPGLWVQEDINQKVFWILSPLLGVGGGGGWFYVCVCVWWGGGECVCIQGRRDGRSSHFLKAHSVVG